MAEADSNTRNLAQINQKLGSFPIVEMADGRKVPTGTVATLLHNIKVYDGLKAKSAVSEAEINEIKTLEQQMKATIPVLKKVGMFDLFTPEEWYNGPSPGRQFVGKAAVGDASQGA